MSDAQKPPIPAWAYFTRIPEWVDESGAAPDVLGAYQQLAKRMKTPRPVEGETPAQKTLRIRRERTVSTGRTLMAQQLGLGPQACDRLVRAMVALGLVEVSKGKGASNSFHLPERPPTWWRGPLNRVEGDALRTRDKERAAASKRGVDVGPGWKVWVESQQARVDEAEAPYNKAAKVRYEKFLAKKAEQDAAALERAVAEAVSNQSVETDYLGEASQEGNQSVGTDPKQTRVQTGSDEGLVGVAVPPKAHLGDVRASSRPSAGADKISPADQTVVAKVLADPFVQSLLVAKLTPGQRAMLPRLIAEAMASDERPIPERLAYRLAQAVAGPDSIRDPFAAIRSALNGRRGCAKNCTCRNPECEGGVVWPGEFACAWCERESEDRLADWRRENPLTVVHGTGDASGVMDRPILTTVPTQAAEKRGPVTMECARCHRDRVPHKKIDGAVYCQPCLEVCRGCGEWLPGSYFRAEDGEMCPSCAGHNAHASNL